MNEKGKSTLRACLVILAGNTATQIHSIKHLWFISILTSEHHQKKRGL